eukprot:7879462-Pyramimonas_sp.AAC.1
MLAQANWAQEQEAVDHGKLHRKKDKFRCDSEMRSAGITASNMMEHMDAKVEQWQLKSDAPRRLERSREVAGEGDWAPITIAGLNHAIDTKVKSKAKGVEQTGAPAFKWLPPPAREELRRAIEEAERMGTLPRQMMVTA